jgi:hypothetical protein
VVVENARTPAAVVPTPRLDRAVDLILDMDRADLRHRRRMEGALGDARTCPAEGTHGNRDDNHGSGATNLCRGRDIFVVARAED